MSDKLEKNLVHELIVFFTLLSSAIIYGLKLFWPETFTYSWPWIVAPFCFLTASYIVGWLVMKIIFLILEVENEK